MIMALINCGGLQLNVVEVTVRQGLRMKFSLEQNVIRVVMYTSSHCIVDTGYHRILLHFNCSIDSVWGKLKYFDALDV